MQIAMIDQGDFLLAALAKSVSEKKFSPWIFDTRIFGRVQEELKNRNKRCYGELEDNRKSCLREIEQLEVSEMHGSGKGGTAPDRTERTGS